MYPSEIIANYFLNKARSEGETLTPLKLIKLVYLAHGWYLALKNSPLIEERILAWKYGPVIRTLYDRLKHYGNQPIKQCLCATDNKIEPNDEALLQEVWNVYRDYTAIELSSLTHEKGSPWDIAWHNQNGKSILNFPIDDGIIKAYYQEKGKTKL